MSVSICFVLFQILNLLGWLVATAIGILVIYGLYDESGAPHLSNTLNAFYNAAHRTGWGLAVAWVVVACATGNGGKKLHLPLT